MTETLKIQDLYDKCAIQGIKNVEVPKAGGVSARLAKCNVKFTSVTLEPPQRAPEAQESPLSAQTIQVIWIREKARVKQTSSLNWTLLTNMKLDCFEDALRKTSYRLGHLGQKGAWPLFQAIKTP